MARFNVTVVDNEINVVSESATQAAADAAVAAADNATTQASAATAAAQIAAALSGPYYPTTAAGIAATNDGEEFTVLASVGATSADIYLNNGGTAVFARKVIIAPGDSGAADLIGSADGTVQSDIDALTEATTLLVASVAARPTSAALAASGGSALSGFIQSGTGAAARTVQAKLRDVINVRDFGAVGDGIANDAAAIQAAIDAAAARGGGCVELPEVTRINSSITISTPNITLTGKGAGASRLVLGNATMNAIVLKGADIRSIEISHLQAESATVGGQTAGTFISLERHTGGQGCFDVKISYITTFNMWRFISTHASTQTPATVFLDVHVNQVVLRDMKYRGFDLTMLAGLKLDQYTISYANPQTVAPAASSAGIYLGDWIDGYWIGNGNILGGEVCFDMGSDWASNGRKPAQGQVWGLSADTGWLQSVRLRDLKTCEFHGLITGNLSGGTNPGGVQINGSGAAFTATDGVDGARFYGGKDANCLGAGFTVLGRARNVYCYGREFISNGRASASGALNNAYVGPNLTKFGFLNCTFDVDTAWFGANAPGYALFIDSGCNDYILGPNVYNAAAHVTGGLFNGSAAAANKAIIAGLA